jgi:hypothetical protein
VELVLHCDATPEAGDVEIVERKGHGHPDTICDAIAERVCIALCRLYRDRCGAILHRLRRATGEVDLDRCDDLAAAECGARATADQQHLVDVVSYASTSSSSSPRTLGCATTWSRDA